MIASKALVTSENRNHVSQVVFLPRPLNEETVSHPDRAWKNGRVPHIWGWLVLTGWWTGMYLKLALLPKATHSSSGFIFSKLAMANTITSVLTVHTHTFQLPLFTASATCNRRRVSASSWVHGIMFVPSASACELRTSLPLYALLVIWHVSN